MFCCSLSPMEVNPLTCVLIATGKLDVNSSASELSRLRGDNRAREDYFLARLERGASFGGEFHRVELFRILVQKTEADMLRTKNFAEEPRQSAGRRPFADRGQGIDRRHHEPRA